MTARIGIQFQGSSNLRGVQAEMAALGAQMEALSKRGVLSNMNQARSMQIYRSNLISAMQGVKGFNVSQVQVENNAKRMTRALNQQKLSLRDVTKSYGNFRQQLRDVITEQTKLSQSRVITTGGRNGAGNLQASVITPQLMDSTRALESARIKLGVYNKALSALGQSTVNWGKNTQWAGRQLTVGFTVPIGIAAAAVGKAAYDMDKEFTRLQKVYGDLNTSTSELDGVKDAITSVAKESAKFGIVGKETVQLSADLAAVGLQGEKLSQTTAQVNRIRALGEVQYQEALKGSIALQTTFKMSNDELTKSFDYINAIENATSLTTNDFFEAIPRAAAPIKAVGGTIKDLGLILVAMKQGGIEAGEGANAIKSAFNRLLNPGKKVQDQFRELTGKDIKNLVDENNGELIPSLQAVGEAVEGLSKVDRQRVLGNLFGTYQVTRLGTALDGLMSKSGQVATAMQIANASTADLAAASQKELDALANSMSGRMKTAIELFKIEMAETGKVVLPIATAILNSFVAMISAFNNLPSGAKGFILISLGLMAIAGPIIMLIGLFGNLIGQGIKFAAVMQRALLKPLRGFRLLDEEMVAQEALANKLTSSTERQAAAWDLLAAKINEVTRAQRMQHAEMDLAVRKQKANNVLGGFATGPNGLPAVTVNSNGMEMRRELRAPAAGANGRATDEFGQPIDLDRLQEAQERFANINEQLEVSRQTHARIEDIEEDETEEGRRQTRINEQQRQQGTREERQRRRNLGLVRGMTMALGGALSIGAQFLPISDQLQNYLSMAGIAAAVIGPALSTAGVTLAGTKAAAVALVAAMGPIGIAAAVAAVAVIGIGLAFKKMHDNAVKADKAQATALRNQRKATDAITASVSANILTVTKYDARARASSVATLTAAQAYVAEQKKAGGEQKKEVERLEQMKGTELKRYAIEVARVGLLKGLNASQIQSSIEQVYAIAGEPITLNIDWTDAKKVAEFEAGQLRQQINEIMSGERDKSGKPSSKVSQERIKQMTTDLATIASNPDAIAAREAVQKWTDDMWASTNDARLNIDFKQVQEDMDHYATMSGEKLSAYSAADRKRWTEVSQFTDDALEASVALNDIQMNMIVGAGQQKGLSEDQLNIIKSSIDPAKALMDILYPTNVNPFKLASADALQDEIESRMKRAAQTASTRAYDYALDQFDSSAKNREDAAQAALDGLDQVFDDQKNASDEKWQKRTDALEASQEKAGKALESRYDKRIAKVKEAQKVDDAVFKAREKMFAAEEKRMQRLATLFSGGIDYNAAIDSGQLDEAAKIMSDMQSQSAQWGIDDQRSAMDSAATKRKDGRDVKIDQIGGQKDKALEKLKDRQKAQDAALAKDKKRDQEALQSNQRVQRLMTEATLKRVKKENKLNRDSLQKYLDGLRSSTPKTQAEYDKNMKAIQKKLGQFGVFLDTKTKSWSTRTGSYWSNGILAAGKAVKDSPAWASWSKSISDKATKAATGGMSMKELLQYLKDPTKYDAWKKKQDAKGADHIRAIPGSKKRAVFHKGGIAGGSGTWRGKSGGNAMDEVDATLLKGEGVLNRKATRHLGTDAIDGLNSGKFGQGGPAVMGGGMTAGLLMSALAPTASVIGSLLTQGPTGAYKRQQEALAPSGSMDFGGIPDFGGDMLERVLYGLKMQESGGNYKIHSPISSASGAYQYLRGTWNGYGGYSQAYLAPKEMQDARARADLSSAYKRLGDWEEAIANHFYPAWANDKSKWNQSPSPGNPTVRSYVNGVLSKMGAPGSNSGGGGKGWTRPVSGPVTSRYGPRNRPTAGASSYHRGVDFGVPIGTSIKSAGSGTVVRTAGTGESGGYGNFTVVAHDGKRYTAYAHQSQFGVRPGQRVNKGQYIGRSGNTGISSGPHLHFGYAEGAANNWKNPNIILPGLRKGGTITHDNTVANLHRGETVLTAPLTNALKNNVRDGSSGGDNITFDFSNSTFAADIDLKKAVNQAMNERDKRKGRGRKIT